MSAKNLKDLFQEELKDIYTGESQILKTLPKLIRAAQSEELREALEQHLEETEGQKQRLETIFSNLGLPAKGKVQVEPADLEGRQAFATIRPSEYPGPGGEIVRRNEVPYDGYRPTGAAASDRRQPRADAEGRRAAADEPPSADEIPF